MNDQEMERYEAELRAARPAPLPKDLMARLSAVKPVAGAAGQPPAIIKPPWSGVWAWAAPALALAAAVAGLLMVQNNQPKIAKKNGKVALAEDGSAHPDGLPKLAMKADYVQVDQELVSSFDLVATLPSGEPVRFRCRQWRDQLVVTDKTNGVEIEKNIPRVEVVPVRFETY